VVTAIAMQHTGKKKIQKAYMETQQVSFEKWFLKGTRKCEKVAQNLNCLSLHG
jgi:hypothetical protein